MADNMNGKTCLITGATDGLGRATAQALAARGAHVIIVGRSPAKCSIVVHEIQESTRNPAVDSITADLSLMAQVRQVAEQFKANHARLHVLINNVGAIFPERQLTPEGFEMTFALNYLGPFVLTNLLLDTLKASARMDATPARIINITSGSHRGAQLDFGDLMKVKKYDGYQAYGQSKLADLVFTYELARRLEGTGVTANALDPGELRTRFTDNLKLNAIQRRSYGLYMRFAGVSVEEGARGLIHLAWSQDVEGITGKFWQKGKPASSSPASTDKSTWSRLWEATEVLLSSRLSPAEIVGAGVSPSI